jgi:hypothetical protein
VCIVGRQRRYLEAGVLSSSGGLVWWLRGRASACFACTLRGGSIGTLKFGSVFFWLYCKVATR